MADTYRGLTIRIGGDTTQLSNAIKGVNRDASNLQSILRKATNALNINPTSIEAANIKMQALSDRSTELYGKFKILESASKKIQLESTFKEAEVHVKKTGDSVGKATERLNSFNGQLEEMKRRFAALDGVDLSKQANYTEWNKGASESIQKMRELGTITEQDYQAYKRLVEAQQQAQNQLDMTKQVAQMRDLEAEIEKTRSQAKSLAEQYVELYASTSRLADNTSMQRIETSLKEAKNAASALDTQLDQVQSALEFSPNSISLVALKMDLLKEKSATTTTQIKTLENKMSVLKNSMDGVDTPVKNLSLALEKNKTEFTEITQKVNITKNALSTLQSELAQVEATGNKVDGKGFDELRSAISKTKSELSELTAKQESIREAFDLTKAQSEYRELQVQVDKCKSSLAETTTAMNSNKSRLDGWASSFTNIGLSLATTVTPAMQQFMSHATESANEIDSAYRNMRKTVNGTEEDFESLKQSAIDFSQTHVTSADQILEIQAMGGQLGIAVEDLDKFSQTVSNLNIATNISDAEEMSQKLGQLASITGMTSDEYDRFADSLVRLGNNTPTLESDIMDVSSRIGSMASIVGMSVPEILALSAAVAATGQQSEAAGTALSNTMSDIENAVGAGGEALQGFADVAGVSAEEFANTWETSPVQAIKSFVTGLNRMETEGGSADEALTNLGITGVRQKQALLGLTQTLNVLDDSLAMSNDAWNGVSDQWGDAGDAAREAERKAEGFSGQLSILQNNAQVLGASLAESLAPILEGLNSIFQGVTDAVDGMSDSQKQLILGSAGLLSVAGALMTMFGAIIPVYTKVRNKNILMTAAMEAFGVQGVKQTSIIGKLGAAMSKQTGIIGKLGTAMAKNTALAGGLAAAGATLAIVIGTQLVSAYQNWKQKQENIEKSTDGLINAQENAKTAVDGMNISLTSTADCADDAAQSYKGLSNRIEEQAQKGAELAESNQKQWEDYYTNSKLLERYIATIEDLGRKGNLSQAEIVELKNAVQGYNEITGSSIEITDEQSGSISEQTEKLRENADEWRKNAEEKARQEQNAELVKRSIELTDNLTQSYDNYINVMKENGTATAAAKKQLEEVTNEYNSNEIAISKNNDALNGNKQSLLTWIGSQSQYLNALNQNGVRIDEFTGFMEQLGLTQTELAAKTPQEIETMVSAYANMNNTLSQYLDPTRLETFRTQLGQTGISTTDLANLSQEQLSLLAENYDDSLSSIITQLSTFATESGNEGLAAALNWYTGLSSQDQNVLLSIANTTGMSLGQLQTFSQSTGAEGQSAITMFANALGDPEGKSAAQMQYTLAAVAIALSGGNLQAAADIVGAECVNGLIHGIQTGEPTAVAAAGTLGDNSIEELRNATDVHSPSGYTQGIGEGVGEGFIIGMQLKLDPASTTAGTMGSNAISSLFGNSQGSDGIGSSFGSKFVSGIGGNVGSAGGKAGEMGSNAKSSLENNSKGTDSTGSFFGQGFVDGISNWVGNAITAAASLGASAVRALSGAIQEGSPSKLTTESGKWFAVGFANGVKNYSDLAVDNVQDMADRSLKALQASDLAASVVSDAKIASGGTAFNGVTNNNVYYQIGNVTIPQESKDGETVENFVNLVLAYKGAM